MAEAIRFPTPRACRPLLAALAALALGLGLAGAASAQAGRTIGPKDQLQIRVDELPTLPGDHIVGEDGTISLGVAGRVDVQGLTENELAMRIKGRLEEAGLRQATVTVRVAAFRSLPVTVLGAVARPGNLTVPGRTTLLDVLLSAGGLAEDHSGTVRIRRRAENGLSDQVEVLVAALFERGDPDANLPIFPGDVVTVPEAARITVLLMGEVGTVGEQTFRGGERATLLAAIAKAGGLGETASNKIVIRRLNASGDRNDLEVDFKRVLNGRDPDVALENGDLIVVKESFF